MTVPDVLEKAQEVQRVTRDRRRGIAGAAVLVLLLLPASDSLPLTRWNLHIWQRLRRAHGAAPDISWDEYYRQLIPYLPASGPVGLLHVAPANTDDAARVHYYMQYALAPRLIVRSTAPAFVIEYGAPEAQSPLVRDPAFELVKSFDAGLRLFRRLR